MSLKANDATPLFETLRKNWRDFVPLCLFSGSLPLIEPISGVAMDKPAFWVYALLAPIFVYSTLRAARSHHDDGTPQWHIAVGFLFFCFPFFVASVAAVKALGLRN